MLPMNWQKRANLTESPIRLAPSETVWPAPRGEQPAFSPATVEVLRVGSMAAKTLAGRGRGVVVSVHQAVVFVLIQDGPVVAILPAETPLHPWAMTVPISCRLFTEREGVRLSGGTLETRGIRLRSNRAEVAALRLRSRPVTVAQSALALRQWLTSGANGSESPVDVASRELERDLSDPGIDLPMRLMGVGNGLTPSGDDALIGLLAGLELARRPKIGRAHV